MKEKENIMTIEPKQIQEKSYDSIPLSSISDLITDAVKQHCSPTQAAVLVLLGQAIMAELRGDEARSTTLTNFWTVFANATDEGLTKIDNPIQIICQVVQNNDLMDNIDPNDYLS